MKTPFEKLVEALDKALQHAHTQGRLTERGKLVEAAREQKMMQEERDKIVKILRVFLGA
jgi:hypothetical protein